MMISKIQKCEEQLCRLHFLGMGAFYYSKNVNKTLLNQRKKLKKNGRLIFSARNRLFDIATLNNYTKKIFRRNL